MKATVASQAKREEQLLAQMRATPMRPVHLFHRDGWDQFAHEEIIVPLRPTPDSPDPSAPSLKARIDYHKHMRMVVTDPMQEMLDSVVDAVDINGGRRDGLLDRVIDGPHKTGKSALLRAVGRGVQRAAEEAQGGHSQDVIPVVHITTPYDPESQANWVWEIAGFLGLAPAPKDVGELLAFHKYPDLTVQVTFVLEKGQTRLLLIDNIENATPDQLASVLPFFDYLHDKFGITTILCGTGASARIRQARFIADHQIRVTAGPRRTMDTSPATPTTAASPSPGLPTTWLHPLPCNDGPQTLHRVLASFEEDLSLLQLEQHALTRHTEELYKLTGGYIGLLSQLICTAAVRAIRSERENITLADLKAINIRTP